MRFAFAATAVGVAAGATAGRAGVVAAAADSVRGGGGGFTAAIFFWQAVVRARVATVSPAISKRALMEASAIQDALKQARRDIPSVRYFE
jgi:hypothetical protein